jgi:hypothetical protein
MAHPPYGVYWREVTCYNQGAVSGPRPLAQVWIRGFMSRRYGRLRLTILILFLSASPWFASPMPGGEPASVSAAERGRYHIYLPGVWVGDNFGLLPAAWASNSYDSQAVTLFRYSFTLTQPILAARLEIFADTRYEVWLDGATLGRGPARFSRTTHEYDVLALGSLGAGRHLLAVMVQWAPNTRAHPRRADGGCPRTQRVARTPN